MKVEVARDKFLSNYEVYEHLKEVQQVHKWNFDPDSKRDLSNKKYRQNHLVNLEAITRDLYSYLSKSEVQSHSPESMKKLIYGLQKFELEKIELLQILNFVPRTMVLLYTIIEECDQRFSEDQCEEMLQLINDCCVVSEAAEDDDVDMDDNEEYEEARES